jgi:hypothetical protein
MSLKAAIFSQELLSRERAKLQYLSEVTAVILIAAIAIGMSWKMMRDGLIFESHDLHYHLTWLQHFSKQFLSGDWYPRWLADTNYGYGSPTFVFYPPLIYYVGSFLKLIGLNIEQIIIAIYCLSLLLAGFGFYLYGRSRWGIMGAMVGAICYVSIPYISLNLYVRGALPETWGLMWLPIGLWLTDKTISRPIWSPLLTAFFALMALTHLPSLILYTIAWSFYTLSFLLKRSWKPVAIAFVSAGLGLGLVSLYLLPALLEQPFVSLKNLPSTSGGVAANLLGTPLTKNVSFLKRYIQPVFTYQFLAAIGLATTSIFYYRKDTTKRKEILCWTGVLFILVFMMSYPSLFIWQSSFVLQIIQHPWRLMGLFSLTTAALCGLATSRILQFKFKAKVVLSLVVVLVLLGNAGFLYKSSKSALGIHNPGNIEAAIAKQSWRGKIYQYIQTGLYDPYSNKLMDAQEYRPWINGSIAPYPEGNIPPVTVAKGSAKVQVTQWAGGDRAFTAQVEQPTTLQLRTYYYPAWHIWVNGQAQSFKMSERGTIEFDLEPGFYTVQMNYLATRVFKLGVGLSLLSLIGLIIFQYRFVRGFQRLNSKDLSRAVQV